jgi:hypothetical protein
VNGQSGRERDLLHPRMVEHSASLVQVESTRPLNGACFEESPTPPPSSAASPADQPENEEKDDRAYRGVEDEGDYPSAEVDTQFRR